MGILNSIARKKSLRSFLAAATLFVGGMSVASAEEENKESKIEQKAEKTLEQKMSSMDKTCIAIVRSNLLKREGKVSHFYLDKEGNWTTYIGLNVDSWDVFSKLDIQDKDGKLLNAKEKEKLFKKMAVEKEKQRPNGFNFVASHYANTFEETPTEESCKKIFDDHLQKDLNFAKGDFGLVIFYNLHPYAQAEIVEKYFNLGFGKFTPDKWKKFFAAAQSYNYSTMAKESHISNISEERNKSTADAFNMVKKTKGDGYKTGLGDQIGTQLVNNTYETLKGCSTFGGALCYGVWNGQGCVKVGNSFPVTADGFEKLPFNECGMEIQDAGELYKTILKGKTKSSVELSDVLICKSFEDFFNKTYGKRCRELFRKKGINLEEMPPEFLVVAMNIDIATGEKLDTYKNFLDAGKKKNYKKAAEQANVSWAVFKKNNPSATTEEWQQFNKENKTLLLSLANQNTNALQVAMTNAR